MRRSIAAPAAAAILTVAVAVGASPAPAAPAAPKDCGRTPSGTYRMRVDAGSPCRFAVATWRAIFAGDRSFPAAVSRNFRLRVRDGEQKVTLDCRANARAHGEFDFACNDLNRYGSHIVRLRNLTLP